MAVDPDSPTPVFTVGRLALWLVLALMVVAIGYSAWIAVANWGFITV
jgi:hypothetical protein